MLQSVYSAQLSAQSNTQPSNKAAHELSVRNTDGKNTEPIILAQDISTQTVAAAEIFNTVIAFSRDRNNVSLIFETVGEGELNYYILGIDCGIWEVKIDGKTTGTYAVDEKRLLHFSACAGFVSLKRSEENFE